MTTSGKGNQRLMVGIMVTVLACATTGCQQATTELPPKNEAPVSIQSDKDSGKTAIDINLPGLNLEIDTEKDGADVSVDTPGVDLKSSDEEQE